MFCNSQLNPTSLNSLTCNMFLKVCTTVTNSIYIYSRRKVFSGGIPPGSSTTEPAHQQRTATAAAATWHKTTTTRHLSTTAERSGKKGRHVLFESALIISSLQEFYLLGHWKNSTTFLYGVELVQCNPS